MAKNFNNRWLMVSQKVYGWLLRAYPPTHREEYGFAMAQLFRDQCRDAWNESQGWGVAKLWLRVLPDLVKTSIIERLAALNKRKSMSDKITTLIQPRRVFSRVFVVVFLLVLGYSIVVAFLLPETYASTARIKVEQDVDISAKLSAYDPQFLQKTLEIIQSQIVLDPVIEKLNLNAAWGRKYFARQTLKSAETLEILRGRISLWPIPNTKLISITTYSDDKYEAAQIANAIAESYRDYQVKSRAELAAKEVEALPAGQEKQAAQLEAQKPKPMLVQITDRAEPGRAPVRPNKTLNIIVGIVVGIVSASALGAIAVFVSYRINKRKQKLNATA